MLASGPEVAYGVGSPVTNGNGRDQLGRASASTASLDGASGSVTANTSVSSANGQTSLPSSDAVYRYHEAFCDFTGTSVQTRADHWDNPTHQMTNARQKLLKLSQQHFLELATDVYDELQRRIDPLPEEREHLMSREDIHPKRNLARQKLSVLVSHRFSDLATDIMYEIERRYEELRPRLRDFEHGHDEFSNHSVPQAVYDERGQDQNSQDQQYQDQSQYQEHGQNQYQNQDQAQNQNQYQAQHEQSYHSGDQSYQTYPESRGEQDYSQNNGLAESHSRGLSAGSAGTGFGASAGNASELMDPAESRETISEFHDAQEQPGHARDYSNGYDAGESTTGQPTLVVPDDGQQVSAEPLRQATIIPKKSTLVEEDDSDEEHHEGDNRDDGRDEGGFDGHGAEGVAAMAGVAGAAVLGPRMSNESSRRSVSFDRNSVSLASIAEEDDDRRGHVGGSDHGENEGVGNDSADADAGDLARSISENKIVGAGMSPPPAKSRGPVALNADEDVYAQLKDKDEQIQMLVDEGSRMDDAINRLEARLRESEEMKTTLMEENERLHKAVEANSEQERQLGPVHEELQQKHADAMSQLESTRGEHERALADKTQLEQTVEELRAEVARLTTEGNESAGRIAEENQQLKSLLEQLQTQLADVQSERDALQSHKTQLTEKHTQLEQEHSQLKATHDDVQGQLRGLEQEHEQLRGAHSELQAAHASLGVNGSASGNDTRMGEMVGAGALGAAAGAGATAVAGHHGGSSDKDLQQRYDSLVQEHLNLQHELEEQQRVTEQVRQEASEFLVEMRTIAESQKSNESLVMEVQTLKMEIQEWKSRYAKAKSEVRNLKAASTYGAASALQANFDSFGQDSPYFSPHGRVRAANVAKFQVAMDEFISKSRQPNVDLLQYLHNVIVATRKINQAIFEHEDPRSTDVQTSEIAQCSSLVSRTANQFITTTRNHCVAGGLSPFSILDAAASDLSFAVLELMKAAKIRNTDELPPAPVSQQQQQPKESGQPEQSESGRGDRRRYASIHDPSNLANFDTRDPDVTVTELQGYLEERTAGAIESTQNLLTGIKNNATVGDLKPHMRSINSAVNHMIEATSTSMQQSRNWLLKDKGSYIVQNLSDCTQRMNLIYDDLQNVADDSYPDRQVKQRLAGISYDMAKCTKELVKTVEEVSLSDAQ